MLHQLRWRKPPRDRRRLWLGLGLALLLHGLFVWITWHELQLPPSTQVVHLRVDNALQVRLIPPQQAQAVPELAPPPPPPPPVASAPPLKASRVVAPPPVREPAAKDAMTLSLPSPPPPTTATLYDKGGQVLLPATAASAAPAYVAHKPQTDADTQVMQHSRPVKYSSTRFDKYFPPPNESLGNAAGRHVVETLTKPVDVTLPHGVHLKCTLLAGCQDPPPVPSPKSRDARLNMAPANALIRDATPPKQLSDEECIAIYRDGKPLPQDCPADTPTRSADADIKNRAAKGL
ncbi:hypothetical protein [Dyella silvatica]|uniref:hypothetical protein n=1 Tax=Dyella silvatica TaxID=2992128 RepID=UPI00224F677E|nr:hypothetical protein [Dyella silvatica]